MIQATNDTKTAVVQELFARTKLDPRFMALLNDSIDNEIALSEGDLTVAEIATEIMLQNKLKEIK